MVVEFVAEAPADVDICDDAVDDVVVCVGSVRYVSESAGIMRDDDDACVVVDQRCSGTMGCMANA